LPIGCFLIRTADRVVLVDAGLGPQQQQLADGMQLVGGQLLTRLAAVGTAPENITDVVCTHLHSDHIGWLFDLEARPVFGYATIWFGASDWDHFVNGPGDMYPHVRDGFRRLHSSLLRPVDRDVSVAPGVTTLSTPGHTPGHLSVLITSGRERALLLGDAITCPLQLDEPAWHSMGDMDVALADHTREQLWREMEQPRVIGVGSHFPDLRFGRVLAGADRRWAS